MNGLRTKTVGIIGTGATAVQCVPPLARSAKHLYIFQRTPVTVGVRANRPTDREWAAGLSAGWQAERMRNFTTLVAGGPVSHDLVNDGWTQLYGEMVAGPDGASSGPDSARIAREAADYRRMEDIRQRVDDIVMDPHTAAKLKPYYRYLCKRPCFHDEYLSAFNEPNVTLVDTDGKGLDEVCVDGVVANGEKFALDCLIYATGFEANTAFLHRVGFDVVGQDGLSLGTKWASRIYTLHGLMVSGFPNLFVVPATNSQSATTVNFMHSLQENATHIAYVIEKTVGKDARYFNVTPAVESDWAAEIVKRRVDNSEFLKSCTPGRWNNEGRDLLPPENSEFGDGPIELFKLMSAWREGDNLSGLEIRR